MTGKDALGQTVERLRAHGRLKLALSCVLPAAFWACYLLAKRLSIGPARAVPQLGLDALVPFRPDAVYLYESLWVLQGVAPWLMTERRQLESYLRTLGLMSLAAMAVFVLWPTANPRPDDVDAANAFYLALVRVDSELNAWPSLHAAFAVYSALGCGAALAYLPRRRPVVALVWLWSAGILAATMLTKQHAVVDVVAGAALGGGAWLLHRRSVQAASAAAPALAAGARDAA